jgi:hypothetical protein
LAAAALESGERVGCAVEGPGGAVGEAGDSMAEKFTFLIHIGHYTAAVLGVWAPSLLKSRF